MGQLQSNKTGFEQFEQEARCGGHTCDLLDSASETSRNLHKNIRELRAQSGQEFGDFRYARPSVQALLATYDIRNEASLNSLRAAGEDLEACQSAVASIHPQLKSDLT